MTSLPDIEYNITIDNKMINTEKLVINVNVDNIGPSIRRFNMSYNSG